jgi:ribosome-associated protein
METVNPSRRIATLTTEEDAATTEQQRSTGKIAAAKERAIRCAQAAADTRGREVQVLELSGLVKWVDYMVVVTGSSRRQIAAIGDEIDRTMKEMGDKKIGGQGYEEGSWLILDYGDVLVHIFSDEKRAYYELEHLWGDAPRVEWQRPEDQARAAAAT